MSVGLLVLALAIALLVLMKNQRAHQHQAEEEITEQDILDEFRAGRKINAVKYYRQVHKVGLREAKEAVEKMDEAQD